MISKIENFARRRKFPNNVPDFLSRDSEGIAGGQGWPTPPTRMNGPPWRRCGAGRERTIPVQIQARICCRSRFAKDRTPANSHLATQPCCRHRPATCPTFRLLSPTWPTRFARDSPPENPGNISHWPRVAAPCPRMPHTTIPMPHKLHFTSVLKIIKHFL
jgi:hypothetical protein